MFPTDMYKQLLNGTAVVAKVALTDDADSTYYGIQTAVNTTFTLECVLYPVRFDDMRFMPAGIIEVGDIRGFFMPSYQRGTTMVTIGTNDLIYYNDEAYEIRSVTDITDGKRIILKEVYGRKR
jgi:hypothetical protein